MLLRVFALRIRSSTWLVDSANQSSLIENAGGKDDRTSTRRYKIGDDANHASRRYDAYHLDYDDGRWCGSTGRKGRSKCTADISRSRIDPRAGLHQGGT